MKAFMDEFDVPSGEDGWRGTCDGQEASVAWKSAQQRKTERLEFRGSTPGSVGTECLHFLPQPGNTAHHASDLSGRIRLEMAARFWRKTVRDLLEEGRTKIILNLGDVNYIDSSGIGELVSGLRRCGTAAAS